MKLHALIASLVLAVTCAATAHDEPDAADSLLASRAPILIQPGANQLLYGVTDDNFAIYQEGQTVYVTALVPGARRRVIAQVPGNNIAFILQVGNVALVWTDPQVNTPGGGLSPLVIWSAIGGARRISESSQVAFIASDVNANNLQVLYTTNVKADGTVGDLALIDVFAATPPRTLLSQIPINVPFGPCRPLAAFMGPPGRAVPMAAYCPGTDTTATLSRWIGNRRIDLIKNIATPMPFTLETNPDETEFLVQLAPNNTPTVVTDEGRVRTVDDVTIFAGYIGDRNAVMYGANPSPGVFELRLAQRGRPPVTIDPQLSFIWGSFYNYSGYAKIRTPSPDDRLLLYSTQFSGFGGDLKLLDARTANVVTIDAQPRTLPGFEIFTSDSRFVLYALNPNPFGQGTLFAADRNGAAHQLSEDDTMFINWAGAGSVVSYNDQPVFNSAPLGQNYASTADLHVIDAARPGSVPRLVAKQAHLFYFPSHQRRGLVFTSDAEARPGLYLASGRP
jgi:hypothetical protein